MHAFAGVIGLRLEGNLVIIVVIIINILCIVFIVYISSGSSSSIAYTDICCHCELYVRCSVCDRLAQRNNTFPRDDGTD